jgi:HEAT repeat protein
MQPREPIHLPDEESRYRDARSFDPEADRGALLARLSDASWRVRKAAVDRLCATREPEAMAVSLLEVLAGCEDVGARNAAAEALGRLGAAALPGLLGLLSEAPAPLRKLSADVLGETGEARAAPALIAALEDSEVNVRAAAAEALGKLGGEGVAPALVRALEGGDRFVALASLEALSSLRHRPPLSTLAAAAQDPYLRRSALRILGAIPGRPALEVIARGLEDSSRGTREAAFEALAAQARLLGEQGPRELARALEGGARIPERAREALFAGSARAVEGALLALGLLGEPADAPAVVRAAARESLSDAALAALRALGPKAGGALLRALPDLTPGARAFALDALSRLKERGAVPALVDLALSRDAAEGERVRAVEALGALGDARAVAPLALLLADPVAASHASGALIELGRVDAKGVQDACRRSESPPAAAWALRVLGALGAVEDLARFETAMNGGDAELREAAAQAAAALGARAAEPLLRRAMADASPAVRAAAARGLGHFASDEAARLLLGALEDGEPGVASAAAASLGRLGESRAESALVRAFERGEAAAGGPEVLLAISALRALAHLSAATPALLLRAAGHCDAEVVKEAVQAAARLPGGEGVLLRAARHARWDARRAAARAIAARGDRRLLPEVEALCSSECDPLAAEAFEGARRALREGSEAGEECRTVHEHAGGLGAGRKPR